MRITNKIMRGNQLYNINQNKILEDKLSTMMTNQSKISRPSDDPVVAIRALRLRTNVTTITQYYDKNTEDAESWLSVTGDAMNTVGEVLKDLYEQAGDASKKSLQAEDLEIILTQMQSLTKEFYASGNVDYAGRYIFSGYRTDTAITFSAEDIKEFTKDGNLKTFDISESFGYENISSISYTDWSAVTTDAAGKPIGDENGVTNTTLYRFRLSYNDLDDAEKTVTDDAGNTQTVQNFKISVNGTEWTTIQCASLEDANTLIKGDPTAVAYVPSTGEVIFGEKVYQDAAKINETMQVNVNYSKSNWKEGDINPVHYFNCASDGVIYNEEGIYQEIYYDVGFNQKIQVNTQAHEIFTHGAQRDMDDFQTYLKQLKDVEAKISDVKKKMEEYPVDSDTYKDYQKQLDALDKAATYIRDNVQTKFENQITKYQSYIDNTNIADTASGTRGSRLELIKSRLMEQKATFKDLQSSNEDADVTEVAVELKSAELAYEAALMATSKIMQTTLMNYI